MTEQHPITPPPELADTLRTEMRRGYDEGVTTPEPWDNAIAKAYQAGADMELDACSVLMDEWGLDGEDLMQCRRPKPLSEVDLALEALREAEASGHLYVNGRSDTIRRQLERLKELEQLDG